MLTIRLQRAGKRNTAQYKVVLAEKTAANQKKFVEILGSYNPHTKELGIRSNDRLNYWMNDQHVELSATIRNLFITKELLKGEKIKSFTIPKKPVVAEEAPAAEAAPTAETPADAAEPVAEAPVETAEATSEPEMVVAVEEVPAEAPVQAPSEPAVEEAPAETPAEIPTSEAAPEVTPEVTAEAPAEEQAE